MLIPKNIIVNADDIGLNPSVNQAIFHSFQQGYINSTSLLTNMDYFDDAVAIIKSNTDVINVGVHGNFAEGKPLTNFKATHFLNSYGGWSISKTNKVAQLLNSESKRAFTDELEAQIEKASSAGIIITHLDSHLHLHTLPAFFSIFFNAAKRHGLKLRLAQTYNEGSYIKFAYRKYINSKIIAAGINHSYLFETVDEFLKDSGRNFLNNTVEIMVHPDYNANGELFDHVDGTSMDKWVAYLTKLK